MDKPKGDKKGQKDKLADKTQADVQGAGAMPATPRGKHASCVACPPENVPPGLGRQGEKGSREPSSSSHRASKSSNKRSADDTTTTTKTTGERDNKRIRFDDGESLLVAKLLKSTATLEHDQANWIKTVKTTISDAVADALNNVNGFLDPVHDSLSQAILEHLIQEDQERRYELAAVSEGLTEHYQGELALLKENIGYSLYKRREENDELQARDVERRTRKDNQKEEIDKANKQAADINSEYEARYLKMQEEIERKTKRKEELFEISSALAARIQEQDAAIAELGRSAHQRAIQEAQAEREDMRILDELVSRSAQM